MDTLSTLVDATLAIEKVRVRTQVRQSHLKLQGRDDPKTDELLTLLQNTEGVVDGWVATAIKSHPAYGWFSKVKGIGKENIGKVVGQIDIEKADTISALWKFAGYAPDNGHAMKRTKGEKLPYNSQLRSMCWRLGGSLLKASGKFYDYYLEQKTRYQNRYLNEGYKIIPTPQGNWVCQSCGASWKNKKEITACCENQVIVKAFKEEPPGVIYEGHVHNMALRKMIKLFLACLWLTWREAVKLPVTKPYAIEQLGHSSYIQPSEMTDR